MDFDRARYFLAVCDAGSIRRAAELVHVTPPALSKAVKTLERELGVTLIAPAGRAIRVTDRGRELARRLRPLLEHAARVAESVRRPSGDEPLRLGSFEVFTTHFLPDLLAGLAGREVVLLELVPGQLESAIVRGQADLGLTYLPIPAEELDHVKVGEVSMGIFARRDRFAAARFEDMPFVIPIQPIEGAPSRVQGLDGWPDERVRRLVRFRVALMESALELCRQGLAAAYLPRFVVARHNAAVLPEFRLAERQRPKAVRESRQGVYLVRRKTDADNADFSRLREALRRALA